MKYPLEEEHIELPNWFKNQFSRLLCLTFYAGVVAMCAFAYQTIRGWYDTWTLDNRINWKRFAKEETVTSHGFSIGLIQLGDREFVEIFIWGPPKDSELEYRVIGQLDTGETLNEPARAALQHECHVIF